MITKYIMVSWPEIQEFMNHERWNECIFCQQIGEHYVPDCTYMIPEDLYNEIKNPIEQFTKDLSNLKAGARVLYIPYGKEYEGCFEGYIGIVEYIHGSFILLENGFIHGINCDIIGVQK